ncbi:MAG: polysaccharide biosynthesis C-terminal domain-containing protein [Lacrimispora sp.]|uniref:oligosaccharide flippase family protein n=1 Tax=Lacrimispora sp. TaxID=2719234 RepID=UPI0039E474A4
MNRKVGVLFSYLLMLIQMLSSLLFTPLLINSLGKSEYGIYSWVNSITAYLYLLDMGIGNSIVKYAAQYRIQKDEKRQKNFLGFITLYYLFIGIVLVVIGIILESNFTFILGRGFEDKEIQMAKKLFWITVLNAAATLFFGAYQKILLAYEYFSLSKSVDILKVVSMMTLGVIALEYGGNSYNVVVINLGVTIGVGVISVLFVFSKLKIVPSIKSLDRHFTKEVIIFSSIVFLQVLATQLNSMIGQVLLGILAPSATVILAVYGTGILIPQYVQNIAANVNSVLMPGVVRMVEEKKGVQFIESEMIRISRIIFIILAFIGIAFGIFGKLFIRLWVGNEYEQSYWIAIILLFPQIIILSQSIGSQILWAMNQHKQQAYLKLSVAIANIGVSIILIKWNPLFGAVIATAITLIIGDVLVMNYVYRKFIKISIKRYFAGILKGTGICLLTTGIVGWMIQYILPENWLGFVAGNGIITCIYMATMLKVGMSEYERLLFYNMLKIIYRKIRWR